VTVINALSTKLEILDIMLQRYIIEEKMSGQVLQGRTGNAERSIRTVEVQSSGNKVEGGVTGGGGTAFYLKYQEDGTTPGKSWEIAPKNGKALAFIPNFTSFNGPFTKQEQGLLGGKRNFSPAKPGAERNAFNKFGGVIVKKVIHPPLPPLKFMSGALQEKYQDIVDGLLEAVTGAVK
jgi:hypothetical protein